MKFNLKKLKECIDTANELGCILNWVEGFEKELRERIRELEQFKQFHDKWTLLRLQNIYIYKEILGEEGNELYQH